MFDTVSAHARFVAAVFVLAVFLPAGYAAAFSFEPMPPSVLMSAAPQTILTGGSSIIVWTVTGADSCIASDGWSGSKNIIGGEQPVAPLVTTTYVLTCTGPGGTSTDSITITVNPVLTTPACSLTASPSTINSGQSATLTWTTDNATIVSINNGIGNVSLDGSKVVTPGSNTSYVLTATGPLGIASCSTFVTVTAAGKANLVPAAPIELVSGELREGGSVSFSSRIKNIGTQSTGIGYLNNFSYRWGSSGSWTDLTPFNSKSALAGLSLALPDVSPIFTLTQSGILQVQYCGDSDRRIGEENEFDNCIVYAFSVIAAPQPVTVTFSANPLIITNGDSTTLTWSVIGADTCTASGGWSGAKNATGGNQSVSPAVTTTYTLTCTGPGGSDTESETVTVVNPPVGGMTLDFRVCNSDGVTGCVLSGTKYVAPSTPLTVRWNATGADSCVGSPNINTNGNTSGTRAVTASALPNDAELFQVSCTDGSTPIAKAVTVRTSAVTPTLTVTPTLVRSGENVQVSWNTGNGDETACVLGGGGVNSAAVLGNGTGGVDTGSANVPVFSRTTFTLVCGTLSATPVTVEIRPTAFET